MAFVRCLFSWKLDVPKGFQCHKHTHPCTELVFNRKAQGRLRQGDRAYRYGDQSVFVYQPGETHWVENDTPGIQICLGVVGGNCEDLEPGVREAGPPLGRWFEEIATELANPRPTRETRLDLLAGLVICELRDADKPRARKATVSTAERIRASVDSRLTERLSLEQLAKQTYLSPEYLRKVFRKEFDEPITRYILRRRLEIASQMILAGNDLIKDIARQCGFPDEFYFSRAFRSAFGKSPSEMRQQGE